MNRYADQIRPPIAQMAKIDPKDPLRFLPVLLFLPSLGEPVHPFRHRNLEPGAFARYAVLGNGDAGDR